MVCVLLSGVSLEDEIMRTEKTPILRQKSLELLKDLTQIDMWNKEDLQCFRILQEKMGT